jgi:PAS domain S-box-containing protein
MSLDPVAGEPPPPPDLALQLALQASMLRVFFGTLAVLCALGAVAMPLLMGQLPLLTRTAMVLGYGSLGVASAIAARQMSGFASHLLPLLVLGGVLVVALVAVTTGWGLQTPGLLFFGLAACMANAMTTTRFVGAAGTALTLATVLALGLAEKIGGPRLVMHCAAILVGSLVGRAVARLVQQHLAASAAREQRFRSLLGIATIGYWETDDQLRLTQASRRTASGSFVAQPWATGQLAWRIEGPQLGASEAEQLESTMRARAPLRDLPFQWQPDEGGAPRHYLASGDPRYDATGRFIGYWGVARDVTGEHEARQALQRSQTLLSRVVSMSPDVITLSELPSGRYVMVSASFCRLLGYAPEEVVGRTARELGLWRDLAERDRIVGEIAHRREVGEMPVELVAKDGRRVPLLITGTHLMNNDGQDYVLINGRDMTEATRARLEREAILANASVGIAFTRERRFELANAQFEQMFGWPTGSLVGQPGRAIWPSDEAYEAIGRDIGPRLARGEAVDVEHTGIRRDGSRLLMRLRAKAIDPHHPATQGTIWIAEDVTEARRAAQELANARDAAEAASRAKSAFLANTSHEIRTPLNGLIGLARLARQPGLPPQRLQQYLDQIGESADLLSTIISDILDLAKIEAGKLRIETAPFDLGDLLRRLQQVHATLAAGQGLSFEAQIDPALPTLVIGDALRVRQVLWNFLNNALKFTAHGGIRLVARAGPGDIVRFEVHDTGLGIDELTQARLFQPFTQADQSTTRRFGGTGLGLAICHELAALMGGQVGVSSRPGRGSCFHAELPLPAAPPSLTPVPVDAEAAACLRGARVLLVEDNAVNMLIGVALLEDWGVQVVEAVNGAQALATVAREAAAGRPVDAVLMDLQMPGMSGYEATLALRRQYDATQLPVIALTAAALVSEREAAAAHGMNDFLTKPIDAPRLQAALVRAIQRRAAPAARP